MESRSFTTLSAVIILIFVAILTVPAQDIRPQLLAATSQGDVTVLKRQLHDAVDPEETDYLDADELLMEACAGGRLEVVKYLVSRGADLAAVVDHETPLMCAAAAGQVEVLRYLIRQGADVDQRTVRGTALTCAAEDGQVESVEALLAAKADLNRRDAQGRTALMKAASKGHADVVKRLLAKGANPAAEGWRGWTALRFAASWGHADTVRIVLEQTKNRNGRRVIQALCDAARAGHTNTVATFAEMGVDLNTPDLDGCLPLTEAATHGHTRTVDLLLTKGAKPAPAARPTEKVIAAAEVMP